MAYDKQDSSLLMYTTPDGVTKVDVTFEEDTVWLTQDQMAELFQKAKSNINEHITNIYADGELIEGSTMRKFGNFEFSTKPSNLYNPDRGIPVGYRVRSQRGGQGCTMCAGKNFPRLKSMPVCRRNPGCRCRSRKPRLRCAGNLHIQNRFVILFAELISLIMPTRVGLLFFLLAMLR